MQQLSMINRCRSSLWLKQSKCTMNEDLLADSRVRPVLIEIAAFGVPLSLEHLGPAAHSDARDLRYGPQNLSQTT